MMKVLYNRSNLSVNSPATKALLCYFPRICIVFKFRGHFSPDNFKLPYI